MSIRIFRNTRGSLAVETAVFLPIFIIGVLTLTYLIKLVAVEENTYHAMNDEVRKAAAHAGVYPAAFFLKGDVENRVRKENGDEIENVDFNSTYLNGIIKADLNYSVKLKLPIKLVGELPVRDSIICRGFIGEQTAVNPMPFSRMEEDADANTVWVFPRSGTKYHDEKCSFIAVNPREKMLNASIRREYKACKLCKPGNMREGNLVYCFITGKVYHRGSCTTVDRYVISMVREEAEKRNYSPCSKCGGE